MLTGAVHARPIMCAACADDYRLMDRCGDVLFLKHIEMATENPARTLVSV